MQLLDLIGQTLFDELHSSYRPTFEAIMKLEKDYPKVALNQLKIEDAEDAALYNSQAHMLYMMQGKITEEKRKTRRELRDALQTLESIPGMRTVIISLLVESFAATIYMIEHLFFLNREIERKIESGELTGYTLADAAYPKDRVDDIVAQVYEIWKADYVLQSTGKKRPHTE